MGAAPTSQAEPKTVARTYLTLPTLGGKKPYFKRVPGRLALAYILTQTPPTGLSGSAPIHLVQRHGASWTLVTR